MSSNFGRMRPHSLVVGAFVIGQLACVLLDAGTTPATAQSARSGRGSGSSQAASAEAASTPASAAFTGQGDGDAKRGRELFVKDACYQCHGYEGQGGSSSGARVGPDPMPPEAMAAVIRKDNGMMPPFSAKLVTDQDVVDIVAFLKTVSKPTDIKNIPTFTK